MSGDRRIRVEEAPGELRIETRPWTLVGRILWTIIEVIFMGIGWPAFIASFFTGSGDLAIKIIFGLTAVLSTLLLIRTWTDRSEITITADRIRWRAGSAVYWRNHDVALADVLTTDLEVKRSRSKDGSSWVTYVVHLRMREDGRRTLAVFAGRDDAANELIGRVRRALGQ